MLSSREIIKISRKRRMEIRQSAINSNIKPRKEKLQYRIQERKLKSRFLKALKSNQGWRFEKSSKIVIENNP